MAVTKLPHCDELFLQFFDRWYDETSRRWRGFRATRSDIMRHDSLVNATGISASPLTPDGQAEASRMISGMFEAAQHDWREYLDLKPPVDLNWVDAFDRFYNRSRIQQLIDASIPDDIGNSYVVTCCEFGAVLGDVMRSTLARLEWMFAKPYWESELLHPPSGTIVSVFHWAIKKMSEYGVDDGFVAKIKACSQVLEKNSLK